MAAAASPIVNLTDDRAYPYAPAAPIVIDKASLEVRETMLPPLLLPVVLALAFALSDFLVAPLMYYVFRTTGPTLNVRFALVFAFFGIIGAQAAVLSVWLVWSTGPFLWRLLIHWGIAGVCCWAWIAGLATVARGTELIDGHCALALAVALVSAAVQAPLWLMRQIFAWRLVRAGSCEEAVPEKASTVGNLMLAMTIAAVAAALARLVPINAPPSDVATEWSIGMGMAAAASALSILPISAALLWQRNIGWGIALSLLYTALAVLVLCMIVLAVNHTIMPYIDDLVVGSTVFVSLGTMLILSAIAARGLGYRLVLGRASRQPGIIPSESAIAAPPVA